MESSDSAQHSPHIRWNVFDIFFSTEAALKGIQDEEVEMK